MYPAAPFRRCVRRHRCDDARLKPEGLCIFSFPVASAAFGPRRGLAGSELQRRSPSAGLAPAEARGIRYDVPGTCRTGECLFVLELKGKPGPRVRPPRVGGARRDAQNLGTLRECQAAEMS
jgi:hypothetical protein